MRSLSLIFVFLAALSSTFSTAVRANDAEKKAQQLYGEGEAAYKAGHFEQALASFTSAYDTAAVSGLLFNIGQCHRQLKHHADAASFFQRYLDEETDLPNRKEIADLVAEERLLDAKEKADADAAAKAAADAAAAPTTTPEEPAIWQSPMFWGIAGGAAVAVLVGSTIAIAVATQPPPTQPHGSLGTFDLRPQ